MSLEIFASGYFFLNFPQYKPQNLLTKDSPHSPWTYDDLSQTPDLSTCLGDYLAS